MQQILLDACFKQQYLLPINYICILYSYKFEYIIINFVYQMRRFSEELIITLSLGYSMKQQCLPDCLKQKSHVSGSIKKNN